MGEDSESESSERTVISIITGDVLHVGIAICRMVQLLNTTRNLIPSISALGRGSSLVAGSEKVNLRRGGGESFTSTDSDSSRFSDHVGYPTPTFKTPILDSVLTRYPMAHAILCETAKGHRS